MPKGDSLTQLLGVEYTGYKGQSAIDKLVQEKQGHIKDALFHPDIGHIDVFWGSVIAKAGLAHIIAERNRRNTCGLKFVSELGEVIENGTMFDNNEINRVNIASKNKVAVITYELRGTETTALLTAFYTKKDRSLREG